MYFCVQTPSEVTQDNKQILLKKAAACFYILLLNSSCICCFRILIFKESFTIAMLHLFYLKPNEILDSFIYLSIMFVTKHILVTNKYSFFFSRFVRRNIQQNSQDVDRNKYQLGCPGNCGHAS